MNYIILSSKPWNENLAESLANQVKGNWLQISTIDDFTVEKIDKIRPEKIFIPHWSHKIHEKIFNNYACIIFHMTDLPFGRGGSPLQNLISRGLESTKITAIRIDGGIDSGDVYLKKDLSLLGTAEEVFIRANNVMERMILEIIKKNLSPIPQTGDPVKFKRRTEEMSTIKEIDTIEDLFNHIRMLDAEGYPKAFLETDNFRLEFSRASLKANKNIIADVKITALKNE